MVPYVEFNKESGLVSFSFDEILVKDCVLVWYHMMSF